jgi:hypothetical protein
MSTASAQASGIGRATSQTSRAKSETALAHVMGDKAEQAYRRSDALENRRKLMEAWAAYCDPKISNKVVQIGKRNKPVAPPVSARPTRPFASAAMSEEDTLYDDRTTRI